LKDKDQNLYIGHQNQTRLNSSYLKENDAAMSPLIKVGNTITGSLKSPVPEYNNLY
jgi:hypothetical protein